MVVGHDNDLDADQTQLFKAETATSAAARAAMPSP
jgi:hypothetical protein